MTDFDYEAMLLDIEGTTTPVTFVYEVLFPYAQRALKSYIDEHWNDPALQRDIEQLVAHTDELSGETGRELEQFAEDGSDSDEFKSAVIAHINWQMEQDKKTTPLKAIQGRIWRAGYDEGELQAPVFEDVVDAFDHWRSDDIPIYIYSSGSVEAQKLLFRNTSRGDLTDYLSGYYDTTTGSKKERTSYTKIAEDIGIDPERLFFATDNLQEAYAAEEAGLIVAIARRPGNADLPEHNFPTISSFDELWD